MEKMSVIDRIMKRFTFTDYKQNINKDKQKKLMIEESK